MSAERVPPEAGTDGAPRTASASIDGDGRVVRLDAGAEELLGVAAADAVGQPLDELAIPPDLRAEFWSSLLGVVSGRTPLDGPVRFRTQTLSAGAAATSVDVIVIRSGTEPLELTAHATPVPEQEERLERAERLLDIGFRVALIAGFEIDLATEQRITSPRFGELLGFPLEDDEMRAEDVPFVRAEDRERFLELRDDVIRDPDRYTGTFHRFATQIRRLDDSVRDVVTSFEVQVDETGAPRWFAGVVQDVTATQTTQREIESLHSVRRSIEHWDDDTGFGRLVGSLGAALDASLAAMWIEDGEPGELWCRAFWARAGIDADDMEAACRRVPIQKGAGATGRAYMTAKADFETPSFSSPYGRAAIEMGVGMAMAFPAVYDDHVLAVVGFMYMDPRPVDERLMTTFETLGVALGRFLHGRRGELGRQPLSNRELQVLRLSAEGLTGPEIAERLGLSPATIKTHFRNLYDKLGVADRAAAVAQAFRLGLLS